MSIRPTVLNFSGNDTAGLAGVVVDIKVQNAFNVHSASIITANTAQNNKEVLSINAVSDTVFNDQLSAINSLPIKAIKVGLIGSTTQAEKIAHFVKQHQLPLVLDPVIASSSGSIFLDETFLSCLKKQLLPNTLLLTPNTIEAEILSGIKIVTEDDIIKAANILRSMGAKAVLIKGGHFNLDRTTEQDAIVQDYFSDGDMSFWLSNKKINTSHSRGTGCALASSVATSLALGYSLYDAVVIAKMAITQGLRQAYTLTNTKNTDKSFGPVNITHFPCEQIDLPQLTHQPYGYLPNTLLNSAFAECNTPLLGLYPVVERASWIEKLVLVGVTTIQLRVKDLSGDALENEIVKAIALGKKHNCRLFINDYWRLALKHKAYGVHLGQEDLQDANIDELKQAGLRLGLSTHCHYEVARAHSYKPSYIACGPVFHTTTKDMPWVPHGLAGLSYWRKLLTYPLVAIGGINKQRFSPIAATGVDSVAMITAITLAENPSDVAADFIQQFNDAQHQ